jgi:N-acetylglucosamine kinase-like BadF-type ATPase
MPPAAPVPLLIAGFDAGQTHTTCRLARLQEGGSWQPLAEGSGGGVCHLAAADGAARFGEALAGSLAAALAAAGLSQDDALLGAAGVGASGIERGSAVERQGTELAAAVLGLPRQRVRVSGDEHTALLGAFGDRPGVLLISGTGCIALGRDTADHQHRCGGWGWLLDGAGSAMDIGRDGLALSVQMADGRLAETALRARLWQALGAGSAQQVKAAVVTASFGAAGFAALAPLVDQLACEGDPHAEAVIERSAEALALMAETVARRLELDPAEVCGVGGALRHLSRLPQAFAAALGRRCPTARLVEPRGDACDGALGLAAQAALRC